MKQKDKIKIQIPKVLVEGEENSKFCIKMTVISYALIIVYFLIMIPMFILCNWFGEAMKIWLSGFYDFDLLIYEVFQQGLLLGYAISKPIIFLYFHGKATRVGNLIGKGKINIRKKFYFCSSFKKNMHVPQSPQVNGFNLVDTLKLSSQNIENL